MTKPPDESSGDDVADGRGGNDVGATRSSFVIWTMDVIFVMDAVLLSDGIMKGRSSARLSPDGSSPERRTTLQKLLYDILRWGRATLYEQAENTY